MRNDPFSIQLQSGKVTLKTVVAVGNGTVAVSIAPFPLKDTAYYQIGPSGDYVQEVH